LCDFAYAFSFGGTIRNASMLTCKERLNRARSDELRGVSWTSMEFARG